MSLNENLHFQVRLYLFFLISSLSLLEPLKKKKIFKNTQKNLKCNTKINNKTETNWCKYQQVESGIDMYIY